jgi:parallel beta-helix repeat protein
MSIKTHLAAAARPALLTAAVVGAFIFAVGPASANHVNCGDTIVADTTLDSDLVNCPNNGIVIGADGITLDVNDHTIDGDGTETSGCDPDREPCDLGVANFGHDGVTVMNGSVREFAVGVLFGSTTAERVRDNRVLGVSSAGNQFAGLGMVSSVRSVVRNSAGDGSLGEEAAGMFLADAHRVRIVGNSFSHNPHVGMVTPDSSRNLIKGNVFLRNGDEAFLMEGGNRFRITRNRVVRNGAGITLGPGSRNVITRNRVSRGRDGIRIEKGRGNLVARNVVVAAGRAGIRLGIRKPFIGGAHNVVRRNLVRDSRVDGFVVVRKDRHSLLLGNIARGAGDDGFDVNSRSTTLTSNRAVRNADLGIEAVFGVIDGGGNRASGNGNPLQCKNVFCT